MSTLNEIISDADMLELAYVMTGAYHQDLEQDILKMKNEITKQRIRRFFDIKRFRYKK